MSDFYKEMLQKSIERQAKEITSNGAIEQDRYGNLLDSVKNRNLEQEEADRRQAILSRIHDNAEKDKKRHEKEAEEFRRNIQKSIIDAERRDRTKMDEYLTKNKEYLDKGREAIRKQQSKTYFS